MVARFVEEGGRTLVEVRGARPGEPVRVRLVGDRGGRGVLAQCPARAADEQGRALVPVPFEPTVRARVVVHGEHSGEVAPGNVPRWERERAARREEVKDALGGVLGGLRDLAGELLQRRGGPIGSGVELDDAVAEARRHGPGRVSVAQARLSDGRPVLTVSHQAPGGRPLVVAHVAVDTAGWSRARLELWPQTGSPEAEVWFLPEERQEKPEGAGKAAAGQNATAADSRPAQGTSASAEGVSGDELR
jgi:hypothetical protein